MLEVRKALFLGGLALCSFKAATADPIVTTALQVGGFLDGGFADNLPSHQNYYVGYGTTPGFPRSPERRSFFWFHIPDFTGEVVDAHISLKMVVSTSLIFGKGPGEPGPSVPDDPMEAFQLTAITDAPGHVTDPGLTMTEAQAIFDSIDDVAIADDYVFLKATPYMFPFTVDVHLNSVGKSIISSMRGADVVLTGWMPTWSEDFRIVPGGGPGDFFEAHELLFGHSEVLSPTIGFPTLTISTGVPEPTYGLLVGAGVFALMRRRRKA